MDINPTSQLATTLGTIVSPPVEVLLAAQERQAQLTKPAGSLGRLEDLGNRLASIQGGLPVRVPEHPVLAVFAADHGVWAQGITPWPQEVTVQMLVNICHGGAAVNALAPETGCQVWPIDIGVAGEVPDAPGLRRHRVRSGTEDFSQRPAMTRDQAQAGLEVGITIANQAIAQGADILVPGEVGLGNTTAASAVVAAMTGADPARTTGRGAGSDDAMLAHKTEIVRSSLALHRPDPGDALGVLAAVGGLDQAGMAGLIIGGAAAGVPVLLDGVISCSAALIAVGLQPTVRDYLIAGHLGDEPGIRTALTGLQLEPLIDLGMRLGEGSGALVALSVVRNAARILRDMATFAEAGVSGKSHE